MDRLDNIINISNERIENAPQNLNVQAIVNAARPTLMGNPEPNPLTVDYCIHKAVDRLHQEEGYLKRKIKQQCDGNLQIVEDKVRCKRGEVVTTPGFGLCYKIFHTVGPVSDEKKCRPNVCSSSLIELLENCYKNVILEILKDPNIKKAAIPVIGAGTYKISYDLAVKTAIATIYNTLLEEKKKDSEFFSYYKLEKIYITIPEEAKCDIAEQILEKYKKIFCKERRVVSRDSFESQQELFKEIQLNDEKRGYFSVAKCFRQIMMLLRIYFFYVTNWLKDSFGGIDWVKRREVVEWLTVGKMLLPIAGFAVVNHYNENLILNILQILMFYNLTDTVTYLMALIVFADIQRPSANIIRSMIMLVMNYVEVALELSVLYYIKAMNQIKISDAIKFGLIGNTTTYAAPGALLLYLSEAVKFFFFTLAFGYFANHLKQRRFRSGKDEIE